MTDLQAVLNGTVPPPRDTDDLPALIAAAMPGQRFELRNRVFDHYGPHVGDLVWRRAADSDVARGER